MHVACLTVGDTQRMTGGYLYHREVFARLQKAGVTITELVPSGADLAAQLIAAPKLGGFDPTAYDLLLIDALARGLCAHWADRWRAVRPLVALVHELPSVAGAEGVSVGDLELEAPLLRADRLITVSEHGRHILEDRGVASARITVAPGGYDRLTSLAAAPAEGSSKHPLTALCVAQWIARKGILDLVRAWSQAAPEGARLELIGETDVDLAYTRRVQAAIARAPTDSIVVHGPISDADLVAAYRRADLFVLPSRYEGYGLVFAEALAHGLPIIAYAVGPVPDLVGPEAGILTAPGNQTHLVTALRQLLNNPAQRTQMAAAARTRAAELPTWDDTAARVLDALHAARQR
ncbi:glycosyltransferase family 4 protein [Candidatus Chloroploca sp. M-50]|uniref:Glycosyltransferase family 4 protein n=1 Tax=Candidatus Chloroploca mongolica TaxID=2528176 RepID=A0ABS4D4M1_9CHLR|nr:glycosyltransferase family 4 protein [Candidatus Chloroploca mongolica]MBP1464389.1 glycosyltransferase family 4 protein [Candidatus Chloroploca mongolica]